MTDSSVFSVDCPAFSWAPGAWLWVGGRAEAWGAGGATSEGCGGPSPAKDIVWKYVGVAEEVIVREGDYKECIWFLGVVEIECKEKEG
jgi:hypothetical protein